MISKVLDYVEDENAEKPRPREHNLKEGQMKEKMTKIFESAPSKLTVEMNGR